MIYIKTNLISDVGQVFNRFYRASGNTKYAYKQTYVYNKKVNKILPKPTNWVYLEFIASEL